MSITESHTLALPLTCLACLLPLRPTVRNIFGGASNNEGLGLFSFCMEWNYIGSANLYLPLVTQLNIDAGERLCRF